MGIDENTLKLLLDQNLSTIKSFVELITSKQEREISSLRQENIELQRSLEFTQSEVSSLKTEISELKNSMVANNSQNTQEISERVRTLEDRARVKNIRICGLTENEDENAEQTQNKVKKLLSEKLQINEVNVNAAFRVGQRTPGNEPRTIIAELPSVRDKVTCLKMSSRLKGTNVYVNEDVSRATQEIRKTKLPLLKQRRQEGNIAYFSGTEIIVKRRQTQNSPPPPTSSQSSNNPESYAATANNNLNMDTRSGRITNLRGRGNGRGNGRGK